MKFYQFKASQKLPLDIADAWEYFSSPANLKEITPDYLNFTITSPSLLEKMYPGTIITYKVHPLFGIPVQWMTEITHIEDKVMFVDEQKFGPYKLWHHKHFFKEIPGGVEMTDIVDYVLPFSIFGRFAHWLFIRKQLEGIFEYRTKKLHEKFGKMN